MFLAAILSLSVNAFAQKEYDVLQWAGGIIIDGNDDDGAWAEANELLVTYEDISDHHDPVCYAADSDFDISGSFKLVYDDTALYVFVTVMDDNLMFSDEDPGCGESWSRDGIELYFITTNDATEGQTVGGDNTVGGMHIRIQLNSDGTIAYPADGIISGIVMKEISGGYVAEMSLNLGAFLSFRVEEAVTITPGETQMGFDAFLADSDPDQIECSEGCRTSLNGWNNHNNGVYNDASLSGKLNLTDEIITSIGNVNYQTARFEIFPNPARDMVYIVSEKNLSEVQIINVLGKQVLRTTEHNSGIDISGLSTGMYFVTADGYTQMMIID